MFAIKQLKREDGFGMLNTLIVIMFFGMMGSTLVILLTSDSRMQAINTERIRAFYAAHSGIEYCIRSISESAARSVSMGQLHNYSETLDAGEGVRCEISIRLMGSDSLEITSTGFTNLAVHTLKKAVNYTNVSDYAVFATGTVNHVRTIPANRIKQNAEKFPLFDYDELRNLAKPARYFSNNLIINGFFYNTRKVTFVEKNLIFGRFSWFSFGNFVTGGNTLIKTSWFPFGFTRGNILQFNEGSLFLSQVQFLWREIYGGLIINGDVTGTSNPHWFYRFTVRHNRGYMNQLLRYSVNGGPIVLNRSTWSVVQ